MERIYFYKMTTDNGGAPHVSDKLLSLAICKPMIRSTAKPGNLILGFAANSMNADNGLIYVAQVSEKLGGDDYYATTYAQRGDCIYERRGGSFVRRAGARYHGPGDLPRDLGDPPDYPRANVLLSREFRYFGGSASADYKTRYPAIRDAVESLTQGHRVEHVASLREALRQLADEVLATPQSVPGTPTTAPDCDVCLRDDDDEFCVVDEDGVRTHC